MKTNAYWDGYDARIKGAAFSSRAALQWRNGWKDADNVIKEGAHAEAINLNPKKRVSRPSQVTGKAPSKRLKARRAKDVIPGYFPNPVKNERPYKVQFSMDLKKTWAELCACKTAHQAEMAIECMSGKYFAYHWRVVK